LVGEPGIQETPSSSLLGPDIKQIKDVVYRHYMIKDPELSKSQQGKD